MAEGNRIREQEITARIYPSVAGLAQPILQVGQFEPQEIKMLGITVHNSPSRDSSAFLPESWTHTEPGY